MSDAATARKDSTRRIARASQLTAPLIPRPGAGARLLIDAEFLAAIHTSIAAAKHRVLLECYMVSSDETGRVLIDLLCERARAGIEVWLVFDAIGSMGLIASDRKRLTDAGARLKSFHPLDFLRLRSTYWRTHRRILIVDNTVAYVGGYGFTQEWVPGGSTGGYHELVLELRGAPLNDLETAFSNAWRRREGRPERMPAEPDPENLDYSVIDVVRSRRHQLRRVLTKFATRARRRLWVATGYFAPTLGLVGALREVARRGVDVKLFLTGRRTDHPAVLYAGRRRYHSLLKAGVEIYESVRRPQHAKAALIDDEFAIVGSSNLDKWSLRFNHELNVLLRGVQPAADLERAMLGIQAQSRHITLEAWQNRPFRTRLLETLFGIADDVL